jgi:fluoroacetyl-CoA thioesterase
MGRVNITNVRCDRGVPELKPSLQPGIKYQHRFVVPHTKTVPALYPEAEEFVAMPEVFATGFLVGFLEWACKTLGTHISVSHSAATPIGLEVTASVELIEVSGRKLVFSVRAHDGVEQISEGRHERFVINRKRFDEKLRAKVAAI